MDAVLRYEKTVLQDRPKRKGSEKSMDLLHDAFNALNLGVQRKRPSGAGKGPRKKFKRRK